MSDQHELEERVKTAQAECERLRNENVRLRAMLGVHDPVPEHPVSSAAGSAPTPLPFDSVPEASTPEQKIALFRGLFRGVYEQRANERSTAYCWSEESTGKYRVQFCSTAALVSLVSVEGQNPSQLFATVETSEAIECVKSSMFMPVFCKLLKAWQNNKSG